MAYPRTRGGSGLFRRVAFAWAWVCLLAQLSSLAHLAVVRHATCLEHAELVHAQEVSSAAPAVAQHAQGTRPDAAAIKTWTATGSEDAHHHCLLCARREQVARPWSAQAVLLSATRPAPRVAGDLPAHAAPLFRLAPKNSPPA